MPIKIESQIPVGKEGNAVALIKDLGLDLKLVIPTNNDVKKYAVPLSANFEAVDTFEEGKLAAKAGFSFGSSEAKYETGVTFIQTLHLIHLKQLYRGDKFERYISDESNLQGFLKGESAKVGDNNYSNNSEDVTVITWTYGVGYRASVYIEAKSASAKVSAGTASGGVDASQYSSSFKLEIFGYGDEEVEPEDRLIPAELQNSGPFSASKSGALSVWRDNFGKKSGRFDPKVKYYPQICSISISSEKDQKDFSDTKSQIATYSYVIARLSHEDTLAKAIDLFRNGSGRSAGDLAKFKKEINEESIKIAYSKIFKIFQPESIMTYDEIMHKKLSQEMIDFGKNLNRKFDNMVNK